jgi:TPR repeat protein
MSLCRSDARSNQCSALLVAIALALGLGLTDTASADSLERASRYIDKGQYDSALPHLRRGARKGDVRCQFLIGMWSLSGIAMEQDLVAGATWIQKAADQGLPVAQAYYGLLYANGLGLERSEEKAAEWLLKAATAGEPMGQAALGVAAFLGNGVPEDRRSRNWPTRESGPVGSLPGPPRAISTGGPT